MVHRLLCFAFCFILLLDITIGLTNNKHRYAQNTDFLLHESGINRNSPDNNDATLHINNPSVGSNPTNSKSNFSPVQVPHSTPTTLQSHNQNSQMSNKRDYVAPNFSTSHSSSTTGPTIKSNTQIMTGKRDYVAPKYPPLNPSINSQQPKENQKDTPHIQTTQTLPKRDYVNPSFPSHNFPNQQGKVKDLINFYDDKSKQTTSPQKIPSYSSIVQGQRTTSTPMSQMPSSQSQKPSFSNIVSGSTQHTSTTTTKKPNNRASTTPFKPSNNKIPTSTRPPVLPSSIMNTNNQRNSGSTVTDAELQTLSEELLRKDTNNAARYITINYQGKTTSHSVEDKAPLPLLTISPEAWNIPTIAKFIPLLDNYERDTLVNEYVTPQERNEENAFMDAIMSTAVIRHLMLYFKEKEYVSPDPKQQRDFLKQLWFSLYSRGKGKISSSGFEHVFVSELKNAEVSGLHNWIYFSKEEQANRLNYLGYLKYEDLNGKGAVVKLHFNQQGTDKPIDSVIIGTSPELEIALYTLCFVTRADNDCNLKLSGKNVNIATYTFRYRSKNLIGSAFPQI
ncbi:hypothetical protein ACJJTC_008003 [Scirpophaga incertulas]